MFSPQIPDASASLPEASADVSVPDVSVEGSMPDVSASLPEGSGDVSAPDVSVSLPDSGDVSLPDASGSLPGVSGDAKASMPSVDVSGEDTGRNILFMTSSCAPEENVSVMSYVCSKTSGLCVQTVTYGHSDAYCGDVVFLHK